MQGYVKKKLLGKGGCGDVWCCEKKKDSLDEIEDKEEEYAVKQI